MNTLLVPIYGKVAGNGGHYLLITVSFLKLAMVCCCEERQEQKQFNLKCYNLEVIGMSEIDNSKCNLDVLYIF
jgi:hypothetical protein